MTNKEAIICLQGLLENPLINKGSYLAQAIEVAIQALSQEPTVTSTDEPMTMVYPTIVCDDAISREAVLERAINVPIAKLVTNNKVIYRKVVFVDDIENLPPVTPQQKYGKWIDREEYDADRWKCSECGRTEQYQEKFCPNCGAKMVEPQESGEG